MQLEDRLCPRAWGRLGGRACEDMASTGVEFGFQFAQVIVACERTGLLTGLGSGFDMLKEA